MLRLKGISNKDYVVAQDLKAERDFKQKVSDSFQKLTDAYQEVQDKLMKNEANYHSNYKSLLIGIENLQEEVRSHLKEMQKRMGDVELHLNEACAEFVQVADCLRLTYMTKQEFYDAHVKQVARLDYLEERLDEKVDFLNRTLFTLGMQFKENLQEVKKDLTSKVPEIDPLKKQLDQQFTALKGNFEGLLQEIAILKKSVAYGEKKFENIYTLIERLKAGKQ